MNEIFLATKFGMILNEPLPDNRRMYGDPGYAMKRLEESFAPLGIHHVDRWYLHW